MFRVYGLNLRNKLLSLNHIHGNLRYLSSYITLPKIPEAHVPIKAWIRDVPVEQDAEAQLQAIAKLPIVHSHVAAMPDVHIGKGALVLVV
ncbi:hypothetical protein QZH41_018248 [Actinostola sp. cb2023]|nr:hypothetical protein QZH41_018248 [Actinostola sp. cb2023]